MFYFFKAVILRDICRYVYRRNDTMTENGSKIRTGRGCSGWDIDKMGYKWIIAKALWWAYGGSFYNSNFYAMKCKQKSV